MEDRPRREANGPQIDARLAQQVELVGRRRGRIHAQDGPDPQAEPRHHEGTVCRTAAQPPAPWVSWVDIAGGGSHDHHRRGGSLGRLASRFRRPRLRHARDDTGRLRADERHAGEGACRSVYWPGRL